MRKLGFCNQVKNFQLDFLSFLVHVHDKEFVISFVDVWLCLIQHIMYLRHLIYKLYIEWIPVNIISSVSHDPYLSALY